MILILKQDAKVESINKLADQLQGMGFIVQEIKGEHTHMLGLAGDTSHIDRDQFSRIDIVDSIMKVSEPYKLVGRKFHPEDTVIDVHGQKIGGGNFVVMAGPCSVESEEQILSIARDVKASGANFIRGGAFKPRTSPYAFQGLGLDGLELLKMARQKTGLPIITELMNNDYLEEFERDVDIIQIGARNMQNFSLLREVGHLKKPVLLKRGMANTIEELLMAAEYLMAGGARDVMLCERGIRTFETATRNTLDLSAVPVLHQKTHLPVIVDPSHGTGYWHLVEPMALAAVAAGADGLIIEVHNAPQCALCDGPQSLTPEVFHRLMKKIGKIREVIA
ncbi:MAG: 3-deoxy-7-phosphoheptulonate synthase [Firmicutes bacterium]|nr:3-deoxy-7-phosphoheptulonate synthase [Bacillota bacterium]